MTTDVTISKDAWTMVLDGEGFAISESDAIYAFADTEPTVRGFRVYPNTQVNGKTGQKLWAKAINYNTQNVSVTAG